MSFHKQRWKELKQGSICGENSELLKFMEAPEYT